MDPVNCPMCDSAIPGSEIRRLRSCPNCGANLSGLIQKRFRTQLPGLKPLPQSTPLRARAALLSLLAPCISIVVYLFGSWALSGSPFEILFGVVSFLLIAAGFIFGVVAFFAPIGERATRKSVAGIFINGLLLAFAIFSFFTSPLVAARGNNAPPPPRKPWIYMSGR